MLPHTSGPAGAADPTAVLPNRGAADPTAVMPPVPQHQPGGPGGPNGPGGPGQGDDPHPWQNQLRAARDRNEQTQIQYLDPSEDPLRRRPQRQVARPQQPQPQQPPQGRRPQQRQPQPGPGYGYPQQQQHQPQQYAPPPQPRPQPPRYVTPAPQQPQAPAPRPQREPRPPRQRSANPMRIPGLGCLKGCLFTVVILFVAGWLVWELSPLQEWIGTGKGYWDQLTTWVGDISDWIGDLGGGSSGSGQ
ncbi:hypothetical protein GCM10017589_61060 [Streptomyces poonensis]|nr:hypothetical protein GCM10017589_61060 [Streptomyces poonensis]